MLVSADSSAAFVRFVVAGQVEQTVAVSGGSAVTEVPVHGLLGSTGIDAYDCDSLVSCATIRRVSLWMSIWRPPRSPLLA